MQIHTTGARSIVPYKPVNRSTDRSRRSTRSSVSKIRNDFTFLFQKNLLLFIIDSAYEMAKITQIVGSPQSRKGRKERVEDDGYRVARRMSPITFQRFLRPFD